MNPPSNLPFEVVNRITRSGTTFELLQYKPLAGGDSIAAIEQLHNLNRAGVHLYQIRIFLDCDAIRTEPGLLQFLKGQIEMESSTEIEEEMKGFVKGSLAPARTGETLFKPLYRGKGEIYLEPTFGHYWFMQLNNQTLYADRDLFCCCEDTVKVSAHKIESFSARVTSSQGRYQTKVSGVGIVVFRIPVPLAEVLELRLDNETLQVDGSIALLRTEGIHFSVEKPSNPLRSTLTNREGLLQTFRGTGKVWVAPTQPFYRLLAEVREEGLGIGD
jgi:uncharacterized protein (AIM24 family)